MQPATPNLVTYSGAFVSSVTSPAAAQQLKWARLSVVSGSAWERIQWENIDTWWHCRSCVGITTSLLATNLEIVSRCNARMHGQTPFGHAGELLHSRIVDRRRKVRDLVKLPTHAPRIDRTKMHGNRPGLRWTRCAYAKPTRTNGKRRRT